MRVLALSNEPARGADPDIPWALTRLAGRGIVDQFLVYSTPTEVSLRGSRGAADDLADAARALQPDVIAFFHTGSCLLDDAGLDAVRFACPQAVWMYREGDPFRRWSAPYPRSARPTIRRCQIAFPFSGGYLVKLLRRSGCRLISYAPSWVNPERFPHTWHSRASFARDVVFIGNNVRSRIRAFPGARERAALVATLQRRYGTRFAVFGLGWSGPSASGPCGFDEVNRIYGESRVCVGIDHTVGPYQFSNRLPIALATGIPLVYSAFIGCDTIFERLAPSPFYASRHEAVRLVDRMLEMDEDSLSRLSAVEREVAMSFSCDRVMAFMLRSAMSLRWEQKTTHANPWIGDDELD